MNPRSFPLPLFPLFLPFLLLILISFPASSAYAVDWFFKCKDSPKCDSIGTLKEFPLWRSNGIEICGGNNEFMKLNCDGDRATIEIVGEKYELLGFSMKDQILILAEIGFPDRVCSPYPNISSSSIYAMIHVFNDCRPSQNLDKPPCSGTEFHYIPLENMTQPNPDAYCNLSALVKISPSLLQEVGGDWKKVAQNITEEFNSERKVDGQACGHCSVSGGVCGYDLQLNQTGCSCQSSSNGFTFCPPAPASGMHTNFVLNCCGFQN